MVVVGDVSSVRYVGRAGSNPALCTSRLVNVVKLDRVWSSLKSIAAFALGRVYQIERGFRQTAICKK